MYEFNREAIRGVVAAWLLCVGIAGWGLGSQALSLLYDALLLESKENPARITPSGLHEETRVLSSTASRIQPR